MQSRTVVASMPWGIALGPNTSSCSQLKALGACSQTRKCQVKLKKSAP